VQHVHALLSPHGVRLKAVHAALESLRRRWFIAAIASHMEYLIWSRA
jgi:hypothetical protein